MIEIKGLHKYFNKGKQNEIHVINDVTLTLPQKGMVAIFGESGCGKTTLLNVIGGLDDYASGTLSIEGVSINDNDALRNQYIGYIFQNYNLLADATCFDNVAHSLKLCGVNDPIEIEKRVLAALKNVGMEKYKNRTPDTLSGGQQQRIAIARAIVKNPPIILADEPTGNLDEANTVMVMDLLKNISKDHLVLIVTHEANLVDHYCDTVIELFDGQVRSMRENENAMGLSTRNKSSIYLGEFPKTELSNERAAVEFYGEIPKEAIQLQIVNKGGQFYVKVNTPKVQIVDSSSEIQFKEGVFKAAAERKDLQDEIDMSQLPPIQGERYGTLFTLWDSIKSGFASQFAKQKKGKKILISVMCLFSAVFTMIASVFGISFSLMESVGDFNKNSFYVPNTGTVDYQTLRSYAEQEESAIDFLSVSLEMLNFYGFPNGQGSLLIQAGFFETYQNNLLVAYGAELDESVCQHLPVVIGKNSNLSEYEVVITTKTADDMLASVKEDYIQDYNDLLNLYSERTYIKQKEIRLKIVGIVRSNEPAIYYSKLFYARQSHHDLNTSLANDYQMSIPKGKVTLLVFDEGVMQPSGYPTVGESVQIRGNTFTVHNVMKYSELDNEEKNLFDGYSTYHYILCEEDYIHTSRQFGESHKTVNYDYSNQFMLIHSSNQAKTEAFLKEAMGDHYHNVVTDYHDIVEKNSEYLKDVILVYITALLFSLGLLSVCMYFIMRSSLMSRIKEIGVYRAIGVSKKNILFRFLIEAAVLTTLTVFLSYLIVSIGIRICFAISPLVSTVIYYPLWLSLAVLFLLYGICLLCGILPVFTLLMKKPSQILAKYDI